MEKRITNIDTLSALIDRLVTERIKHFFFKKDGDQKKADHQEIVIHEIKTKLIDLFQEVYINGRYEYLREQRTFNVDDMVKNIDELVTNDIHIGESDRSRLAILMMEEKRLRMSNEGRSMNKNKIDEQFDNLIKKEDV